MPVILLAAAVTAACGSSASSSSSAGTSAATTVAASATGTASAATGTAPAMASASASGSASAAATGKLTGAAATALVAKALANTEAASSVRVQGIGVGTDSGSQMVSFDITLVRNKGCEGAIALSKVLAFKLVEAGGYVWLKPSTAYYASLHLSKAAIALVADKYIKVKSSDRQLGSLAKICTFHGLFSSIPVPTGTSYVATPASYGGQPAYDITQAGQRGYADITNTSTPVLLKLADTKHGAITFTQYNAMTSITPPSAAESIDGSALGV